MPSHAGPGPGIVLISASDTDLLAAQASAGGWRLANPARTAPADLQALLDGAFCVVLRLLGGRRSWPEGLAAVLASGLPTVVLSGEPAPDAGLMSLSTVPAGVAAEALAYLREGGPANLAQLARFLSDTILLTGEGFEPPEVLPAYGPHPGPHGERPASPAAPPSASCSTARTRSPGTPRSQTRWPMPSRRRAATRPRSSAARCGPRRRSSTPCSAAWTRSSSRCSPRAGRWPPTRPRAGTTRPGMWPRWPRWMSRCSRRCA